MEGRAVRGHFSDGGNGARNAEAAFGGAAYGWIAREGVADAHERRDVGQVNPPGEIVDDAVDAPGDPLVGFCAGVHLVPGEAQFVAQVRERPADDKRNVAEKRLAAGIRASFEGALVPRTERRIRTARTMSTGTAPWWRG